MIFGGGFMVVDKGENLLLLQNHYGKQLKKKMF